MGDSRTDTHSRRREGSDASGERTNEAMTWTQRNGRVVWFLVVELVLGLAAAGVVFLFDGRIASLTFGVLVSLMVVGALVAAIVVGAFWFRKWRATG